MVPSHVFIQKKSYTVGALLKFLKSSNLLVYLSNGKIYANIPTNLRLSILLTIQTEKDILEPYSILTQLQKTENILLVLGWKAKRSVDILVKLVYLRQC